MEIVELSFCCSRRAVLSLRKDIGLPESAIAKMDSDLLFQFTICPFRPSSVIFADVFILNDSEIAITEKLSLCNSIRFLM